MRATILTLTVLLSGCATLEDLRFGTSPTLDPSRIYRGSGSFNVERQSDLERYTCLTGVMECRQWGIGWSCGCP